MYRGLGDVLEWLGRTAVYVPAATFFNIFYLFQNATIYHNLSQALFRVFYDLAVFLISSSPVSCKLTLMQYVIITILHIAAPISSLSYVTLPLHT